MQLLSRKSIYQFCAAFSVIQRGFSMQAVRSDGQGGRGITLIPRSGTYSQVVLWFHGLGDTADGWASLMPRLGLENTKFILPTAPVRPISLNGGMEMPGWSDIFGLDAASPEDKPGFDVSAERINKIIQAEIDQGIPAKKIIVAGFSQGGALALHTTLRSPLQFAGCVALSTWLPFRDDYPSALSEEAKTLPVFQVHGDADRVVPHRWGQITHEKLTDMIATPKPEFMTVEDMGHSSDPEEIEAVKAFITRVLQS